MYLEASYIGRKARHLLGSRDIMALNNLVDTRSGTDWYTAAGILHDLRARNTPITAVANIPYFQNLFPGIGGVYSGNAALTSTQEIYALVARDCSNNASRTNGVCAAGVLTLVDLIFLTGLPFSY